MTSNPHSIGYTVNGISQGVAFWVKKTELNGQALFPHVLTKNQNFTVNFGQLPSPLKPLMANFLPIGQIDASNSLVRGPIAPSLKQECEVLMMIGLPGAGKTFWAENYRQSYPSKCYNILGTNNLIDRMKVEGLPRSKNYHGRWEVLIDKCTDCFNSLLEIASKRKRNYILDQTNVFPTARARKLKAFQDMCCKAIVVVPTDAEFQRRCTNRTYEFGKEIPESAILNMKANFVLPEYAEMKYKTFSEVLYVELDPHKANQIVQNYNFEATSKGVHITPAVHQFLIQNSKLRADENIKELIGKLLPPLTNYKTNATFDSCGKLQQSEAQDAPWLNPVISNDNVIYQHINMSTNTNPSKPVKKEPPDTKLTEDRITSNSTEKDEFERESSFRLKITSSDGSIDTRDLNNRSESYESETYKSRHYDNYNRNHWRDIMQQFEAQDASWSTRTISIENGNYLHSNMTTLNISNPVKEEPSNMMLTQYGSTSTNTTKDEFGRDNNFRSRNFISKGSIDTRDFDNRSERYDRKTYTGRYNDNYNQRYGRSRSKERVRRNRSRSKSRDRNRKYSRRSRSRSRSREQRNCRTRRSTDRSKSIESSKYCRSSDNQREKGKKNINFKHYAYRGKYNKSITEMLSR